MQKITKIIGSLILTGALLVAGVGSAWAANNEVYNWYCIRTKDHRQPPLDAPIRFIESCGGYYVDHAHSDPNADDKVVYLTFDVGYENGNVAKVLDALKAEDVPGAFFILGHVAEACPDLVRRMDAEGHLVCNHTYGHGDFTGRDAATLADELKKMATVCTERTGVTMAHYFRPPEGKFDRAMLENALSEGYKTIFWSFAYADWDNKGQPSPTAAKRKILDNVHNGAVILLHPTSATNAAILEDVIRELKSQGYRFGTLDELTASGSSASTLSTSEARG